MNLGGMPMNSKTLSSIKSKLGKYLKDKEILDIILFGSAVKGKELPGDIDIAIISKRGMTIDLPGFHITSLKPEDFFIKPPSIIHTLFREGYSLKSNIPLSELYNFSSKVLFKYELTSLKPSAKVRIVNILHGKNKEKGLVEERNGKWLANQVFLSPIENEYIFEKFFLNFDIRFNKFYVLIH